MDRVMRAQPVTMMAILWGALLGLHPLDSSAKEVYRWVDETGRVHMSDTVPEQYKSSAKRYDSRQFERTEEQKRQAVIDSTRAAEALKPAPPPPLADPIAISSGTAQNQPPLDPDTADCNALHQQFKQAQECYTPYRTKNLGIRGHAFQNCVDIPAPPTRCGLQKIYP